MRAAAVAAACAALLLALAPGCLGVTTFHGLDVRNWTTLDQEIRVRVSQDRHALLDATRLVPANGQVHLGLDVRGDVLVEAWAGNLTTSSVQQVGSSTSSLFVEMHPGVLQVGQVVVD